MNCPQCEGQTIVLETRRLEDKSSKRRRKCLECSFRFNTVETLYFKEKAAPAKPPVASPKISTIKPKPENKPFTAIGSVWSEPVSYLDDIEEAGIDISDID